MSTGQGPVVLLWDIDGTLLTTNRAGIAAWEDALHETTGIAADLTDFMTAGLTDGEIAAALLSGAGADPGKGAVELLLLAYETRLPEALGRRQGRVLHGVVEILASLPDPPACLSLLLTGNTQAGAQAKLGHYGIGDAFPEGGAFCRGAEKRASIARRALALGRALLGRDVPGDRVFVIGDTPHDIRCGKAIGARTIAVATGAYALPDLRDASPWVALERLPEAGEFRALVSCGSSPTEADG